MPVISVKMGKMSTEKKKELIKQLTVATAKVTNIPEESITMVIEEYDLTSIGVGGQTLAEKYPKQ